MITFYVITSFGKDGHQCNTIEKQAESFEAFEPKGGHSLMEYKIDSVADKMEKYILKLQRFNLQIKPSRTTLGYRGAKYTITLNSLEELNELGEILDEHLILKPGLISIYDGYNE